MLVTFFQALFGLTPDPHPDGFGQSTADDIRYCRRARTCRKMQVRWRRPEPDDLTTWNAHPIVSRFGDDVYALADVDGRVWIVKDRLFSGWPDPPEYAFFVIERGEVWAATDFDRWPKGWSLPPPIAAA